MFYEVLAMEQRAQKLWLSYQHLYQCASATSSSHIDIESTTSSRPCYCCFEFSQMSDIKTNTNLWLCFVQCKECFWIHSILLHGYLLNKMNSLIATSRQSTKQNSCVSAFVTWDAPLTWQLVTANCNQMQNSNVFWFWWTCLWFCIFFQLSLCQKWICAST